MSPHVSGPTVSTVLRAQLGFVRPMLHAVTDMPGSGPLGRSHHHAAYMDTLHGLALSCRPLLELALRRCRKLAPGDTVADRLAHYYEQGMTQVRDDDQCVLAQLAANGTESSTLVGHLPSRAVADLAGAQYYWIEHHHPVALLGYLLVLEDIASFSCDSRRGSGHVVGAIVDLLESLPLTAQQQATVVRSAMYTAEELVNVFKRHAGVLPVS